MCYLQGEPIYKYQIDENHRIIRNVNDKVSSYDYGGLGITDTLPSKHRNEIISAFVNTIAIGYTQSESITYFPNSDAESFVNSLEDGNSVVSAISVLTGIPSTTISAMQLLGAPAMIAQYAAFAYAGLAASVFSLILGMVSINTGIITGNIRDITDEGGDVMITYVTNTYGSFYDVSEWDGRTCVRDPLTGGTVIRSEVDVTCPHGNPWD